MKKRNTAPILSFFSIVLLLSAITALFAHWNASPTLPAEETETAPLRTVILDAGHGGEDGGAETADGILEKDLNLAIVFLLRDLLEADGVRVILTRDTDTLLYDRNVDYHGRKKALDFAARQKIAEETPDSVFVSIHMNTYPRADCTGLQVWYSPNHPDSKALAETIQGTTKTLLQPENHRTVRASGSNIYLLHHLESPAVLVECGFLSTPAEAEKLTDPAYQKQLAFTLFCALKSSNIGT